MKSICKIKIVPFVLLMMFFSYQIQAQQKDSITKQRVLVFEETFSLYFARPFQLGDHTLAEDYKNRFGVGARLTLFSVQKINFGMGGEYISYTITEPSRAGNFTRGNYKNAFILANYPININEELTVNPVIGIGMLQFTQREVGVRYSNQDGKNYRIGATFDYELGTEIDAFIGLEYVYTKFDLSANPDIFDYYGKSNAIQISLGIKFKSPKNKR